MTLRRALVLLLLVAAIVAPAAMSTAHEHTDCRTSNHIVSATDPDPDHPALCVAYGGTTVLFFSGHPVNTGDPSHPCGELWVNNMKVYDNDEVDDNTEDC